MSIGAMTLSSLQGTTQNHVIGSQKHCESNSPNIIEEHQLRVRAVMRLSLSHLSTCHKPSAPDYSWKMPVNSSLSTSDDM